MPLFIPFQHFYQNEGTQQHQQLNVAQQIVWDLWQSSKHRWTKNCYFISQTALWRAQNKFIKKEWMIISSLINPTQLLQAMAVDMLEIWSGKNIPTLSFPEEKRLTSLSKCSCHRWAYCIRKNPAWEQTQTTKLVKDNIMHLKNLTSRQSNVKIQFKIHKRGVSDNIFRNLLTHERNFFTDTTSVKLIMQVVIRVAFDQDISPLSLNNIEGSLWRYNITPNMGDREGSFSLHRSFARHRAFRNPSEEIFFF